MLYQDPNAWPHISQIWVGMLLLDVELDTLQFPSTASSGARVTLFNSGFL